MFVSTSRRDEVASTTHAYLNNLEGLACVQRPEINVVVVQRSMPVHVAAELGRVVAERSVGLTYEGSATKLDASVFLGDAFETVVSDFLDEDITALALAYAHAARKEHVKIALSTVTDDACRKFHADYVDLRMLCTYVGPGTEVLDEPGLRRVEMENADPYLIANPKIRGEAPLFRAAAGDVVVLKGRAYPGNASRGAVHRSPAIEASAGRRLVLKIDGGTCGC